MCWCGDEVVEWGHDHNFDLVITYCVEIACLNLFVLSKSLQNAIVLSPT